MIIFVVVYVINGKFYLILKNFIMYQLIVMAIVLVPVAIVIALIYKSIKRR